MILNETPIRTSKNFGINNIEIEDNELKNNVNSFNNLTIIGDTSDFEIANNTENLALTYGINKNLENQIYENANQNIKIISNKEKNKSLILEFEFDEENESLIDNIEIDAKKGSKSTVIIKYEGLNDGKFYHNGILKTCLEPDAELDIILVNMINIKSNNILSIQNILQENSILNYTIIDFGGKNSVSNLFSNLIGNEAKCNLNTIYLGTENQMFDINYIMELRGEKTEANIEVQGALKDSGKKNFKGTIDFKKGAKKAKGNENEFCMLLSKDARSKALPMLLCTEEDVDGNHSSAAGKVEEKMLFYIMSRGFSYKDAMKLIVKAKFNNILETIYDEELKAEILGEIDKRLD